MINDKIYCIAIQVCLLLVFLWVPWGVMAEEITLIPSVDVTGGYDDNVYYTRTNQEADYAATVRPGFILDYDSELFNIRSRGSVEFFRYLHNSSLNRENYYVFFDGGVNLTEKWNLRGNFSFIDDTTLETQLEETGIVNLRTDRKRYNGGGELSYRLTDLSNAGLSYNHQSTRYGSDRFDNYDYDSVRFSYDYRFNNGLDLFTVLPYYDYWRSDISNVNNYGLSFGLSHTFTETFSSEVLLGVRYTETELTEVEEKDGNWGGVANIELTKRWTVSSVTLGYSYDLGYSSRSEPININRIFCRASHRIISRLSVAFTGSFYITKSESEFSDRDNRYVTLTPSLDYEITENYSLRLSYNYSREFNETLESAPNRDRNRVWLTFTGELPMKW